MATFKRVALTAAGGVFLLLASGCDNKNKSAATPRLQSEAAPAVTCAPAQPASSSRLQIYRPRTQAELDELNSAPTFTNLPAPRPAQPAAVAATPDSGESVVADPSWNVSITREWRHIVVHHSASAVGSAAIFDRAHKERGWDGLGYHFVIGNGSASGDGEVEVGYRWARQMQGAHAGNAEYNQAGIGICLVGDFQHGGQPSARQMASLRRLTRFLQAKTGVPTYEVIGHGNVPGKSTECPGQYLNLPAFRDSLGSTYGGNVTIAEGSGRSTSSSHTAPRSPARSSKAKNSIPSGL